MPDLPKVRLAYSIEGSAYVQDDTIVGGRLERVFMLGFGKRISYAFRCFFSVLSKGEIPEEIAPEIVRAPAPAEAPKAVEAPEAVAPAAETSDRAVQVLALLQREGRLVDFLTEDIAPYQDDQIGAAVRDVHESCRKALERYLRLEPIIAGEEGGAVTVEPGFDPAAIKLIGNVMGRPPMRGVLRHRGWRVKQAHLPPLPDRSSRDVVAPAEVEVI
jgi:hypothetical protein